MTAKANFGGSGIMEETFKFICELLPPGKTVLEFGSGDVSTAYLSKRYKLFSVEDKAEWIGKHNSTYIHAPLVKGWYDLSKVLAGLPATYDLILVDGPTGEGNRGGFLENVDSFYHECPIIFDDTNRAAEKQLALMTALRLRREVKFYDTFAVLMP